MIWKNGENGYDFLCVFFKKCVFYDCFMILFMIFYVFFVFSLVFMCFLWFFYDSLKMIFLMKVYDIFMKIYDFLWKIWFFMIFYGFF